MYLLYLPHASLFIGRVLADGFNSHLENVKRICLSFQMKIRRVGEFSRSNDMRVQTPELLYRTKSECKHSVLFIFNDLFSRILDV